MSNGWSDYQHELDKLREEMRIRSEALFDLWVSDLYREGQTLPTSTQEHILYRLRDRVRSIGTDLVWRSSRGSVNAAGEEPE